MRRAGSNAVKTRPWVRLVEGNEPTCIPTTARPAFFSVVIPAFNEQVALPRCLQTLREQFNGAGLEAIVIDNNSTDATAEVARVLGAKVTSCAQRGVVHARQEGLLAAQGEIIVQMDADSWLPPGALSLLKDRFADPGVVAVVGDVRYVPGTRMARIMQAVYRKTNDVFWRLVGAPGFAAAGALAFRREALLAAGGYDTRLSYSGDETTLLPLLARAGRVLWEPTYIVESDDRRFRAGFLRFLVFDLFIHTFLDQTVFRLTKRSLWGDRRAVR